ncbi:hypothetical protein, conserved [Babesia bigemina]|uniref:C3H1-type domain-containing protein n=1 Tax=Babesia bigemina TaxID=5866 RepID=A0A061BJI9_BABBI|nr:hypothetical protein, conserved [Babesia bigemina]CDR71659.1 hypothetical protein, conserved [Babesia bigemina]|eukprot:XP_012770606.1 hypothetical protein, conserved [Babesia bigemina]
MKESCKSSHSRRYDDATKRALKDIEEREKQLEDLKKKLEAFIGKKEDDDANNIPAKNLLTHLCDGLETFLGFDNQTKGYTGKGIVYSDLDRLCDGVMGFLSGVLEAVKDDPSVTTYYTKMDKTLETIKISMHNPDGLSEAVKAVSQALGEWDREVTEKTSALKNRLKTFNNDNIKRMHESLNALKSCQPREVTAMLTRCIGESTALLDAFNLAETNYNQLDISLRNKMSDTVRIIEIETKLFIGAASNDELRMLVGTAEHKLEELRDHIHGKLIDRITIMKNNIDKMFNEKIVDPITNVKAELNVTKVDLDTWIDKTKIAVENALNRCSDILGMFDKQNKNYKEIEKAAGDLYKHAETLSMAASSAKRDVEKLVNEAQTALTNLDGELKRDLKQLEAHVSAPFQTLISNASDFNQKFISTKTAIETAIEGVETDIEKLKELSNVDQIRKHGSNAGIPENVSAPLLKAIGGTTDSFEILKKYFRDLNVNIMGPLKEAMGGIEGGVGRVGNNARKDLENAFSVFRTRLTTPVKELQNVVNGNLPNPNFISVQRQLNAIGVDISGVTQLNLGSHASMIDKILPKLSKHSESITHEDVKNLLNVLRNIAKAVSEHSQQLVQQLLNKIQDKVKVEIKGIAETVNAKITKIKDGLQNSTQNKGVQYSAGGKDVSGLQKLVSEFDSKINQDLTILKSRVDSMFRKKQQDAGDNNYDLETIMQDYHNHAHGDGVNSVKSKINALKTTVADDALNDLPKIGYVIAASDKITTSLSSFAGKVEALVEKDEKSSVDGHDMNRKGVKTLLTELKTIIGDSGELKYGLRSGLTKIKDDIVRILGTSTDPGPNKYNLKKLLDDASVFYRDVIQMQAIDAINNIQAFVTSEIAVTTADIQTNAKEEYHNKISKMFESMKTEITSQIAAIETEIADDLNSGVKGLLRKVMDHDRKGQVNDNLLSKLKVDQVRANDQFRELADRFKNYAESVIFYIGYEVAGPHPGEPGKKVDGIKSNITALLEHLKTSNIYNYDSKFTSLLSHLSSSLTALHPSHFANPRHPELLDAVRAGLQGFVKEMERVYVNGYDGGEGIDKLSKLVITKTISDGKSGTKVELTDDGRNLSKVFFSIIRILGHTLKDLQHECATSWKDIAINTCGNNSLGQFFQKQGYEVNSEDGKQTGELLDDKAKMKGDHINKNLISKNLGIKSGVIVDWKKEKDAKNKVKTKPNGSDITLLHILEFLFGHLERYYHVRHLEHIPSAKAPRNIYQMLQWLNGLRYNPILTPVYLCIKDLFPRSKENEGKDIKAIPSSEVKLSATKDITYVYLAGKALIHASIFCHDVLVAIQGHGHAGGRYACDFSTNEEKLLYPNSGSACFDMLVDIAERLYHQFRFLYSQCENGTDSSGWADCWYGRGVGGSGWNCNTKQCPNQNCPQLADQNAGQRGNQSADQTCDSHPKCGLKSPLQSFLEDGLQGFLPHSFTKPGCKLECTVSNHRGLPCKTPMGFSDISQLASHTKKGNHLIQVLKDFCGEKSHLRSLCAGFMCLLQKPPQTLGDMFAFYYNYIYGWNTQRSDHRQGAFDKAVSAAHFENKYDELIVHNLYSPSHSAVWQGHSGGSLGSLVCTSIESVVCGPYLYPINSGIRDIYAAKYADKYLSWIVYQTETFYDLLKKLYDECNSNCGPKGSNCLTTSCVKDCLRLRKPPTPNEHHDDCKSIVQCRKALPTLSKYGFVFLQQAKLNGNEGLTKKRTCQNFCAAFKDVFNKESLLVELIRKIDEFIFAIREPFTYLVLALWSLSLFYLICVMVGRLDVLHIRSHLRSPSSHRITAQSLLAAAQVGRLAKISYLQP